MELMKIARSFTFVKCQVTAVLIRMQPIGNDRELRASTRKTYAVTNERNVKIFYSLL